MVLLIIALAGIVIVAGMVYGFIFRSCQGAFVEETEDDSEKPAQETQEREVVEDVTIPLYEYEMTLPSGETITEQAHDTTSDDDGTHLRRAESAHVGVGWTNATVVLEKETVRTLNMDNIASFTQEKVCDEQFVARVTMEKTGREITECNHSWKTELS